MTALKPRAICYKLAALVRIYIDEAGGFIAQPARQPPSTWGVKSLLSSPMEVEHLIRDQEAGGSNPLAPTNLFNDKAEFPRDRG